MGVATIASSPGGVFDLKPKWDTARVLRNPCKGWYHHYYDNGTENYPTQADSDLDEFPGMDHLYIRVSWAHFEPEDGHYNWSWIDDVKDHWVPKGYGISLRISTCETSESHATPEWVIAAGAKGGMHKAYRQEVWVPDYADPVYLAKLDRFVAEMAKRYDGLPWLRYVDIGLGTWGEGHNHPMFDAAIPMGAVKKHIDIYKAHFHRSVLVLSDDAVHIHGRTPAEERELREYAAANGISWRDDSILTWPGLHNWPETFNVARPEFFEDAWRRFPTVLESSHYNEAIRDGAYKVAASGNLRAYDDFVGSAKLTHATYLGYHGSARTWLKDNPDMARELANLLGYWYFPSSISTPEPLASGKSATLKMAWENKGTACAYQSFMLGVKLTGSGRAFTLPLVEANNRAWMPGTPAQESYRVAIPADLPAGRYELSVGLFDTSVSPTRVIEVGLQAELRDAEGYYHMAEVNVGGAGRV